MSERVQKFKLSAPSWRRELNVLNRGCKHCDASGGVNTKLRQVLAWRGESWICTLCSDKFLCCPVAPQHITLPGTAQKVFQEHKSSQKLSELFQISICLCGAGITLKASFHLQGALITRGLQPQGQTKRWIWDLANPTCFWQSACQEMIFPQRSCCDGWEEEGEGAERAVLSVAVAEPCRTWCWWLAPSAECWDTTALRKESGCAAKDTQSSLAIWVPRVKRVLNEARVLCSGQSWILNSSMVLQLLLKNGANIFLLPGRFLRTNLLAFMVLIMIESKLINKKGRNCVSIHQTHSNYFLQPVNLLWTQEFQWAHTSRTVRWKNPKSWKKFELRYASNMFNVIVPLNPCP